MKVLDKSGFPNFDRIRYSSCFFFFATTKCYFNFDHGAFLTRVRYYENFVAVSSVLANSYAKTCTNSCHNYTFAFKSSNSRFSIPREFSTVSSPSFRYRTLCKWYSVGYGVPGNSNFKTCKNSPELSQGSVIRITVFLGSMRVSFVSKNTIPVPNAKVNQTDILPLYERNI